MTKILFVCHGNICRSPMAEFVMKDLVEKAGLSHAFEIASAATSTEEIGNGVYPPARTDLKRRGIPCLPHWARQVTRRDYQEYDLLLCMDSQNVRNLLRLLGGDPEGKVRKLLEYAGQAGDVADPWYTGGFDRAYEDIYRGCAGLMKALGYPEFSNRQ
ncbi:MAG: low molecular weight protein-tyrosine-phosphatase [Eubacteriales bacterium]|nr:low molecular weight protein-tyrosine-phosphatase [Eubacteriales bacterium]